MKDSIFENKGDFLGEQMEFFEKTSILKKVYQNYLKIRDKYPNDDDIENIRVQFRQALNNIECCEGAMQEIYNLAIKGLIANEVLPSFVELLRHWQGKHIDLREFRRYIQESRGEGDGIF